MDDKFIMKGRHVQTHRVYIEIANDGSVRKHVHRSETSRFDEIPLDDSPQGLSTSKKMHINI